MPHVVLSSTVPSQLASSHPKRSDPSKRSLFALHQLSYRPSTRSERLLDYSYMDLPLLDSRDTVHTLHTILEGFYPYRYPLPKSCGTPRQVMLASTVSGRLVGSGRIGSCILRDVHGCGNSIAVMFSRLFRLMSGTVFSRDRVQVHWSAKIVYCTLDGFELHVF